MCAKPANTKMIINPFARGQALLSGQGLNKFIREQIDLLPQGANVLTVGAGGPVGSMLEARAQTKGLKVTSFDIDEARGPDIIGDIATYDFKEHEYDAVFMIEVLEHVAEMHKVPEQVLSLLKDGGRLVLSTPFIFPIHDSPYDFYRYTHYGLKHLFQGFRDVAIQPRNSWAEAINVLIARTYKEKKLSFRLLGAVLVLYALLLQPLHWALGKMFKSDFMTSGYMMVANK